MARIGIRYAGSRSIRRFERSVHSASGSAGQANHGTMLTYVQAVWAMLAGLPNWTSSFCQPYGKIICLEGGKQDGPGLQLPRRAAHRAAARIPIASGLSPARVRLGPLARG